MQKEHIRSGLSLLLGVWGEWKAGGDLLASSWSGQKILLPYLAVVTGCWLGSQLRLSAQTATRVCVLWLLELPHNMVA